MTDEFAHVWAIHKERSSGHITQIDIEVHYAGRALRLPIHLIRPVDGQQSRGSIIARELTALGEALIRIAHQSGAVIDENPPTRVIEPSDRRATNDGAPSGE